MMNRTQSCYYLLWILLATKPVFATTSVDAKEMLNRYFNHLQTRFILLEDENIPPAERLGIRTDLVNGKQFWLPVKGKPGRAFNLISFFQRTPPSSWEIRQLTAEPDQTSMAVDFSVDSFPGHPWRTRFELLKQNGRWLILSFNDLTKRPIPPGADIQSVLEHYLIAVQNATARIYSGELSREEKQKLTMKYGFGAGYWVGQSSRKDLPAGTLFSYLLSRRTFSWEIEPEKIAGDYAEAVVHIHSKPKFAAPIKKTYTIELSRLDKEWFLANHRSKKPPTPAKPTVKKADPSGQSPSDIVHLQLQLLQQDKARLTDLADASKPLWIKTRQARQGMGRLFGMAMGSNGGKLPEWEVISTEDHGDKQLIMVKAIWSDQQTIRLFHRIQFSLTKTDNGWRLSDAQLLRN